ncbi:MAG: PQQ-dependent sugar dehydrogenase [Bacteroidota bacterium]
MRPLLILLFCSSFLTLVAQPALELTPITPAGALATPVDIAAPDDGTHRLFIVEKAGRVKIVDLATNLVSNTPFLDISNRVVNQGEQGFLGLVFHPDFAENGEFFVNYSSNGNTPGAAVGNNVISRITLADPTDLTADPSTEEVIMVIDQPFSNHNGGDLAFGPDGMLYIGTGDGGGGGDPLDTGQDPQSLLGKMLRIKVDSVSSNSGYDIPADNPFVNDDDVLDEIWSLGLRNPWRYSFDRQTGDLWIGDVGQNAREEIDLEWSNSPGGLNFGWDCREGLINFSSSSDACSPDVEYVDPVADISHFGSVSAFSITGGYVYRGGGWPELNGIYICADFVTDLFFTVRPDGVDGWELQSQSELPISGATSFGESALGELYVVDISGNLFQISGGMPSVTRNYFSAADFSLHVSPNPAERQIRLDFGTLTNDAIMKVRVVDASSKTVLSTTYAMGPGAQSREMHLPKLPAGVYRVLVTNATGGRVATVVIKG